MTDTVLVIEDEELQARSIKRSLERHGYNVQVALNAHDGVARLQQDHPDILLLDLHLGNDDGLQILKNLRASQENVLVIIMTAYAKVQTAVEAMRLGAYDYVTKPLDLDELHLLLQRACAHVKQTHELVYFRERARLASHSTLPLGKCPSMQRFATQVQVIANIERRASDGAPPVLLLGETGTGKGFVARMLHDISARSAQPFIELNCAALPQALLEAELFGHEKGAFTDARTAKRGLFEAADGGSLFLDEIGHISFDAQAKLLHAIETRSFRRLGSLAVRHVDVRLVAATNVDLDVAVTRGSFRPDLFHRLNVLTLRLPPLRERGEDILFLAEHFVEYHSRQYGLPLRRLSREAKERLMIYHWPGNVRELGNEIERALLLEDGDELELSHLVRTSADKVRATIRIESSNDIAVDLPAEGVAFTDIERAVLQRALTQCDGNVTRAARLLRLSRDTLRYRIEKLGLRSLEAAEQEESR